VSTSTRIGSTIAGYRLEALLGRGGMSVVYLAEHLRLGRKVALKILAPTLSQDADFRERFERESRRAAEIDHPNIIPVFDAGEADGALYIAMRYVKGSDLKSMLEREETLGVGRTLYLLEQAAAALDAAHARDLVHRDVKPANILVEQPSEHVFLSDFGIVKQTTDSRGLTRTGIFVGTVDYAAPEQIEGRGVDHRTDVYALGCVLYECLTGRIPFSREGEVAIMHAHLTEAPPQVTAVRADLPAGLNAVIARAMAKDREDRYQTCGELIAAARAAALQRPTSAPTAHVSEPALAASAEVGAAQTALAGAAAPAASGTWSEPTGQSQPPAAPPPPASTTGRRFPPWVALAAAVVAAAVAGVVVYLVTRDSEPSGSASPPAATQPPATEPPATAPPATEPPATEPPATEPPATEPPATQVPPTEEAVLADGLEPVVDPEIWQDCAVKSTPNPGATESAVCLPPAGETRRFDSVELSLYPDAASLAAAYEALKEDAGVSRDSGRCNATRWTGEGAWLHGEDRPGGRRFCYFDENGDVVVVWTHEKLGQPTHLDTLGIARRNDTNHAELFAWWNFWIHQIGLTQTR
jgi:serine/threonine-protein kinase